MNKFITFLFLILISSSTKKTENQSEKKDVILEQLEQSGSWIKKIFEEVSDLTISNDDLTDILTERFSKIFMVDFRFTKDVSNHERLFSLFNQDFYIDQFSNEIKEFDQSKLTTILQNLQKPDSLNFDEVYQKSNGRIEIAKLRFLDQLRENFQLGIDAFIKNMIHQFYVIMETERNQNSKTISKEFVITEYKNEIKTFFQNYAKTKVEVKFNNQFVFDKEELNSNAKLLKKVFDDNYDTFKKAISALGRALKGNSNIFYEIIKYSIAKISDYVRNEEKPENLVYLISTAQERISDSAKVLNILAKSNNNDKFYFEKLFAFMKDNTDRYRQTFEVIFKSDSFKSFLGQTQKDIFLASLGVVSNEEIVQTMKDIFQTNNKADINNEDIIELVNFVYTHTKFDVSVGDEKNTDLAKKLKVIDFILYLPNSEFSLEMIRGISEHFVGLRRISKIRRETFSKTKLFFHDFKSKPIFSKDNVNFYLKFYYLTLDFAGFIDEQDSIDYNLNELFDQFLDAIFRQSNDIWVQQNYLLLKIYNLFFIKAQSTYVTTFPKFESDNIIAFNLVQEINKEEQFGKYLTEIYKHATGNDDKKTVSTQEIIEFLSDLHTQGEKFRKLSITFQAAQEEKKLELKKKDFNFKVRFVTSDLNPNAYMRKSSFNINSDDGQSSFDPNESFNDERSEFDQEENFKSLLFQKDLSNEIENTGPRTPRLRLNQKQNESLQIEAKKEVRENLVNEVVGKLTENQTEALKHLNVRDFVDQQQLVVTKDNVETTYVFVLVTRNKSPCYPKMKC